MFSDSMLDEVTKDGSVLGYALEIWFPDGPSRSHTGVGEILIDGETYYGVGDMGTVSTLESVGDENPIRFDVELSGVPGELLKISLEATAKGSNATLFMVVFDPDTGQLIKAEAGVVGFITDYQVVMGDNNRISVTIADEFELFEMPWYEFWTDESVKNSHDGDRIARYTSQIADRQLRWGGKLDAEPYIRG